MKSEYLFFGPHMARLRRALRHGTRTEDLYPSRDADSIAHIGENDAQYDHDFFFRAKLARDYHVTMARRARDVNPPRVRRRSRARGARLTLRTFRTIRALSWRPRLRTRWRRTGGVIATRASSSRARAWLAAQAAHESGVGSSPRDVSRDVAEVERARANDGIGFVSSYARASGTRDAREGVGTGAQRGV